MTHPAARADLHPGAGRQPQPPLLALTLSALCLLAHPMHADAATLNDTGQSQCASGAGMIACSAASAGQDGRQGRDAQAAAGQLTKAGAGAAGFDFTALDALGMAAAPGGHECVADNVTGLVWSTETLPAHTWAQAGSDAASYTHCDIASGWRLPTRRELLSIVHHGASGPAIDGSYFPATASAPYWSADTAAGGNAWAIDFGDGATLRDGVAQAHAVRLVTRPVNTAPTLTLGADIVVPREERPGPRTYPGWATGISPGPAREAGQHLTATVTLLPVTGQKALEFEVPPAIDLATGDLSFTIKHKLVMVDGVPQPYNVEWESSAGLARVQVTLQDDGGTANGGVDSVTRTFEIWLDPTPRALDINIDYTASCHYAGSTNEILLPVTLLAWDADTDPVQVSPYIFENTHWPTYKIKTQPSKGFIKEANIGAVMSSRLPFSVLDGTPMGNYNDTLLYTTFSTTFDGVDSFTYTVVDKDGNESNEAQVVMNISQASCPPI